MTIDGVESIKEQGFTGFHKIAELKNNTAYIPEERGVYLVLRPDSSIVQFVEKGTGGFFKKKNPNVTLTKLVGRWIEDAEIVYIGKAGGLKSRRTLRSRLEEYMKFGTRRPVAHWGGRYIWQIKDIDNYVICWKELPDDDPRKVERHMLSMFEQEYGRLPFANINR